jgi:hypothetical protein
MAVAETVLKSLILPQQLALNTLVTLKYRGAGKREDEVKSLSRYEDEARVGEVQRHRRSFLTVCIYEIQWQ